MADLNRRDFLKGAAVMGAIGVAGVTGGCSPSNSTTSGAASQGDETTSESGVTRWSWETAPEPIADNEIVETREADVLIIGAGLAGCAAAARAAEMGASVIVLEKNTEPSSRGVHYASSDSKLMREAGLVCDINAATAQWSSECCGYCDEEIIGLYMDRSPEVMDWLIDQTDAEGYTAVLYGGYYQGEGSHKEYPGTHMFVNSEGGRDVDEHGHRIPTYVLHQNATESGAEFIFEMPAEQLIKDGDKVIGTIAKGVDGYRKFIGNKGVILATGDIGSDKEMLECYAPAALLPEKNSYTPIGCNTGDGHKMGLWVGGQMETPALPTMIHLIAYGFYSFATLNVNANGTRYMNEDNWVQPKSNNILRQPGGKQYAWAILDSKWPTKIGATIPMGGGQFWDDMAREYGKEWTPDTVQKNIETYLDDGRAFTASTIEELAALIEADEDTLAQTVNRYNELSQADVDEDFRKKSELLSTIDTPPYYALKFGPTLLCVPGGLNVNTSLQVLDSERNPIEHLYAIGNTAGGRYGNEYPVAINGTSHGSALTFGYVVAENIVNV